MGTTSGKGMKSGLACFDIFRKCNFMFSAKNLLNMLEVYLVQLVYFQVIIIWNIILTEHNSIVSIK